jgi:hypothetical protein
MIKLKKILNEIGDSSAKPFNFLLTISGKNEYQYMFLTKEKKIPYYIIFKYISKSDAWDISFSTIGSKNGDEVINSGEMYSVMATIVKIIKDFISKKNPEKLQYSPAKNFDTDLRRAKLYDVYLKKNLNGWDVSKSGDYVVLTNPNVKTNNKQKK